MLKGPSTTYTSSGVSPREVVRYSTIFGGIEVETSSRTAEPKRRRRNCCCTVRRRSPASSSRISMSASRVTRKRCDLPWRISGKSASAFAAMMLPRKTNFVPESSTGTRRGTTGGSLMRAKRFPPCGAGAANVAPFSHEPGSTIRPRLRLRFETYGKGWPGSTACGVRMGKTFSMK